jgi:hypothetical protein
MRNAWLLLGMGLVLAGLASLLYFAAAVLDLLPEAASGWPLPDRLQVGLGFALFGVAVTALGVGFIGLRRRPVPRVEPARSPERVEPFIGPAIEPAGEAVPGFRRMGARRGA